MTMSATCGHMLRFCQKISKENVHMKAYEGSAADGCSGR